MNSSRLLAARRLDWMLAGTVLVGAWLLFQVEPIAAKRILPWFGGGPAVWTTAMLFFQALLLAGYLYAHLSARWLSPRAQAIVHTVLLIAAGGLLAAYGVVLGDNWKPQAIDRPQWQILVILMISVGLPYMMLSATAPLVQTWWGRTSGGRSPYRLYALSNLGSLAALLSYPLVVEPVLGIHAQGMIWTALFVLFGVLCAVCAWFACSQKQQIELGEAAPTPTSPGPSAPLSETSSTTMLDRFLWLALPACASVMLLAVTNFLCQDIAPVPLLWIAPLVVYLITFILAFESDRWYRRWPWLAALFVCSFAACKSWRLNSSEQFALQISIHLALLLIVGMICHGEVVRLRPAAKYLTSYYLCLAAGGAIGGLFVAVLAPQLFTDYYELPLGLLATWLLAMCVLATDRMSPLYKGRLLVAWMVIVAVVALLAIRIQTEYLHVNAISLQATRNFFGVLKVQEGDVGTGQQGRFLLHGRISHGMQYLDPTRRREPTQYYIRASGVGQLLDSLSADKPRRVGVVGLGAGTLATYANAGDEFAFYDINPQVIEFANRYFTFLADARERGVKLQIVTDDARLALEREPPQQFDVLALDAFSGDAIPVHLLTMEAFEQYLRHLRQPGGVLAVHITNRNLDLAPVVQAAADRFNLEARVVTSSADPSAAIQVTLWALLYPRNDTSGRKQLGESLDSRPGGSGSRAIVWTDDYSSLLSVLKRR